MGMSAEVVIKQGCKPTQGSALKEAIKKGEGAISLVLAAGNQSSIPFMDAIYK